MWVRGMRVDLARDHRVEALGQASCSPVVTEARSDQGKSRSFAADSNFELLLKFFE